MKNTDTEIGTIEASRVLGIHRTNVVFRAIEVDPSDTHQVKAALKDKRLPGRKVGRFWLFRRDHVLAFGELDRPTGRPRKVAAA